MPQANTSWRVCQRERAVWRKGGTDGKQAVAEGRDELRAGLGRAEDPATGTFDTDVELRGVEPLTSSVQRRRSPD